ncbi:hypothetical protein FHX63_005615 [Cupriavidus plantarum]|nr:hypothetical protein [Cupriavidus plantarum]
MSTAIKHLLSGFRVCALHGAGGVNVVVGHHQDDGLGS